MAETKLALMERLRAEGRWDEADKFRAATRARLKAEGMRRNEAREEAWRLVAEKYPRLEAATVVNKAGSCETAAPVPPRVIIDMQATADFETAVRWTWSALSHDPSTIDVSQAPHPGCLELLKFARSDRATFFGWLAKYDMKAQQKADKTTTFQDDRRKHFRLFEKLEEYWKENPDKIPTSTIAQWSNYDALKNRPLGPVPSPAVSSPNTESTPHKART